MVGQVRLPITSPRPARSRRLQARFATPVAAGGPPPTAASRPSRPTHLTAALPSRPRPRSLGAVSPR
ncbi:hypothetical protein ZWY2020_015488 [Hordeum vulgare]|nr:hypothetical protein ZWY2020_015488 [Hordeum vulgare]